MFWLFFLICFFQMSQMNTVAALTNFIHPCYLSRSAFRRVAFFNIMCVLKFYLNYYQITYIPWDFRQIAQKIRPTKSTKSIKKSLKIIRSRLLNGISIYEFFRVIRMQIHRHWNPLKSPSEIQWNDVSDSAFSSSRQIHFIFLKCFFMGCVIRRDNSYDLFVIRRDCIESFTVHTIPRLNFQNLVTSLTDWCHFIRHPL